MIVLKDEKAINNGLINDKEEIEPKSKMVDQTRTYKIELGNHYIYLVVGMNEVKLLNEKDEADFMFCTSPGHETKERWEAVGKLIIKAAELM